MSEQSAVRARTIAVPSLAPGGLEAERSGHFGHCDYFTIIKVGADGVGEVEIVANLAHEQGGCLAPVELLASLGTTEIVVGGMGARPLAYFEQLGIDVYVDQQLPVVGQVVDALLEGGLPRMSLEHVCGGGSGGCH